MGADPPHLMGHENLLAQVRKADNKEATKVMGRGRQGVPTSGERNGGAEA